MESKKTFVCILKYHRVILLSLLLQILLIYIAMVRFDLQKNAYLNHKTHSSVQWLQPSSLDKKFPLLIGNNTWSLNYTNVERMLWESTVSVSEKLVVNSETAEFLQQVSAQLPKSLKPKESKRLAFLLEQSLPDGNGKQLADLIIRYHVYVQEYISSLYTMSKAKGEEKLSLLKASRTQNKLLQERHFGIEIMEKLFGKKNVTANYLNDRRIINMDESLTKAQKKGQLSALEENYKKHLLKNRFQNMDK